VRELGLDPFAVWAGEVGHVVAREWRGEAREGKRRRDEMNEGFFSQRAMLMEVVVLFEEWKAVDVCEKVKREEMLKSRLSRKRTV